MDANVRGTEQEQMHALRRVRILPMLKSSVTSIMSAFFVSGSNNTSFDQWLHAPSKVPQEEDHDPALIVDRNHLRASNCFSSTPYCSDQSDCQMLPGSEALARNSTCVSLPRPATEGAIQTLRCSEYVPLCFCMSDLQTANLDAQHDVTYS
jgi:hypothetical protein